MVLKETERYKLIQLYIGPYTCHFYNEIDTDSVYFNQKVYKLVIRQRLSQKTSILLSCVHKKLYNVRLEWVIFATLFKLGLVAHLTTFWSAVHRPESWVGGRGGYIPPL